MKQWMQLEVRATWEKQGPAPGQAGPLWAPEAKALAVFWLFPAQPEDQSLLINRPMLLDKIGCRLTRI